MICRAALRFPPFGIFRDEECDNPSREGESGTGSACAWRRRSSSLHSWSAWAGARARSASPFQPGSPDAPAIGATGAAAALVAREDGRLRASPSGYRRSGTSSRLRSSISRCRKSVESYPPRAPGSSTRRRSRPAERGEAPDAEPDRRTSTGSRTSAAATRRTRTATSARTTTWSGSTSTTRSTARPVPRSSRRHRQHALHGHVVLWQPQQRRSDRALRPVRGPLDGLAVRVEQQHPGPVLPVHRGLGYRRPDRLVVRLRVPRAPDEVQRLPEVRDLAEPELVHDDRSAVPDQRRAT